VFLLLLCNDKAVLGPWRNGRYRNAFTGAVIWVLVMLSIILTASTVFPDLSGTAILQILGGGTALGLGGFLGPYLLSKKQPQTQAFRDDGALGSDGMQRTWRMPPLDELSPPSLT